MNHVVINVLLTYYMAKLMSTIISNTSPLIAFSAINRLDLLRGIFAEVLIPEAVRRELFPSHSAWTEARAVQDAISKGSWINVVHIDRELVLTTLPARLGHGEIEAISLAAERELPVLIDDLAARKAANDLGRACVGTLAILARHKNSGTLSEAGPLIEEMRMHGIHYGNALVDRFLKAVGERQE